MHHEIKLTSFAISESGIVEVGIEWNGAPNAVNFPSVNDFYSQNSDMIQSPQEAARVLIAYLLLLGNTHETLPAAIGKALTLDVNNAVQQVISVA